MQHLKKFRYFTKHIMKYEKLSHILSHESDLFHMTNNKKQIFDNISEKEIEKVCQAALKNFNEKTYNVFQNILIKYDSTMEDVCCIENKTLKINCDTVLLNSKNLNVPIDVVLDTAIYYELAKLIIQLNKKDNKDVLDLSDGEEIWCEKFAYSLYQLDRLPSDAEELLNVTESERGQLPLFYYNNGGMYGRSSIGNVGVTVHKDKKDYTPYDKLTVYSDNNGNMYTDSEVDDLYAKYTVYCTTNNVVPVLREELINPDTLSKVISICD